MIGRECSKCKVFKTADHFYKCNKYGIGYYCKQCLRVYNKQRYKQDPDFALSKWLKSAYGLTIEDVHDFLNKQNNCCAICETSIEWPGFNTAIDHCHDTGLVRGVLCKTCNLGLGHFKDDMSLLNSALAYLNRKTEKNNE